jgi:hypothetical protein
MVAHIRQALEADRFDQAFGADSRLGQQEAVAAVRDHRGVAGRESPLPKEPSDVCPASWIGHPCGKLHGQVLRGWPLVGVPSDLRCSRLRFGERDAPAACGTAARP